MAWDNDGRTINEEMVQKLGRFNRNDVPMKLCYTPSTCLTFEIEKTYQEAHEEDTAIYWQILPSQMRDVPYIPVIGETITFAKQYEGEILSKSIIKDFVVIDVHKEIDQDTTRFCLYITVSLLPKEVPVEQRF